MILKSLNLLNYKNFDAYTVEFDAKINCFVGSNGVGKTKTVINIAAGVTQQEKQVLVIDFDPLGDATTGLGLSGLNNCIRSVRPPTPPTGNPPPIILPMQVRSGVTPKNL